MAFSLLQVIINFRLFSLYLYIYIFNTLLYIQHSFILLYTFIENLLEMVPVKILSRNDSAMRKSSMDAAF